MWSITPKRRQLTQDFNQHIRNWSRITWGMKNQEDTKIVDKFSTSIELSNTNPLASLTAQPRDRSSSPLFTFFFFFPSWWTATTTKSQECWSRFLPSLGFIDVAQVRTNSSFFFLLVDAQTKEGRCRSFFMYVCRNERKEGNCYTLQIPYSRLIKSWGLYPNFVF